MKRRQIVKVSKRPERTEPSQSVARVAMIRHHNHYNYAADNAAWPSDEGQPVGLAHHASTLLLSSILFLTLAGSAFSALRRS